MDQQALEELIALFLKINPTPSDEQFHSLARALGTDPETLESVSYGMLSEDEDLLDDVEVYSTKINAGTRLLADSQIPLDTVDADPDDMSLQDLMSNDGDPTADDLGMQQETKDDGFDVDDKGAGLVNNVSDVLSDDGVLDTSI